MYVSAAKVVIENAGVAAGRTEQIIIIQPTNTSSVDIFSTKQVITRVEGIG